MEQIFSQFSLEKIKKKGQKAKKLDRKKPLRNPKKAKTQTDSKLIFLKNVIWIFFGRHFIFLNKIKEESDLLESWSWIC